MATTIVQHGINGAYVGGDWVPIEECASKFNIKMGSGSKNCDSCTNKDVCPRSQSKTTSIKPDGTYDVIIIGSGCIGSAIARELSKMTISVLLLEAADDVTQGATKGNSGIVHAGYDDEPGSVRSKFCWKGNQMFPDLDRELHFGYQKNGSLVIARNIEEMAHLEELRQRGITNGVQNLRILDQNELFEMEPNVQKDCVGALYAPDAGNLIPYEYAIALAENAVDNGVELRIRREVTSIILTTLDQSNPSGKMKIEYEGVGEGEQLFEVTARHWEPPSYLDSLPPPTSINPPPTSPLPNQSNVTISTTSDPSSSSASHPPLVNIIIFCSLVVGMSVWVWRDGRSQSLFLAPQLQQSPDLVFGTLVAAVVVLSTCFAFFLFPTSPHSKPPLNPSSSSSHSLEDKKSIDYYTMSVPPSVGTGGSQVSVEEMRVGGSGSSSIHHGVTVSIEKYRARFIVNCAGLGADKVAEMIGDTSFYLKPRIGDYLILNRSQGGLVQKTIFPCPGPLGKGVLVQTSLWGTLILGPTARDVHVPQAMSQTPEEVQAYILSKCRELVPVFDAGEVILGFSGARAKSSTGDWVIRPSEKHPRFILAAGIDSPGLAGSPAIAVEVVRLLSEAGLTLTPNPTFNPLRAPIITPKSGWKGIKAGPSGKYTNPKENVVCKCEKVTEEEVVEALHRSLPVDSTQAVRKRTRAGMGFCQGRPDNYDCESRVAALIARETGLPIEAVGRRPWPATSTLPQRWITEEQKDRLRELQNGADPNKPLH